MTSLINELLKQNKHLSEGVTQLSARALGAEKDRDALKKILKEIIGDYNAAYSVGLISHSMYSIKKAKKLLDEMEAK